MNREKPYFLKRLIAYLIDLIIVMLLAGILSSVLIKDDNYKKETEKLLEITSQVSQGKITQEEYFTEFDDINYYLTKDGIGTSIITISVSIAYYVILCYFCGGITLGKHIMKLGIVSANDKKLHLGHFFLRALLVNLILSNIASIVFVLLLNKESFISIYPKVSNALTLLLLATLIFMMYRDDGRGIHDLIANTKVISTKEKKEEVKEEIKEAEVIETKKTKKNKNKKENGDK